MLSSNSHSKTYLQGLTETNLKLEDLLFVLNTEVLCILSGDRGEGQLEPCL